MCGWQSVRQQLTKKSRQIIKHIRHKKKEKRRICFFINILKKASLFFAIYLNKKYISSFLILCRTLMKFQVAIAESVFFTCADRFF